MVGFFILKTSETRTTLFIPRFKPENDTWSRVSRVFIARSTASWTFVLIETFISSSGAVSLVSGFWSDIVFF